VPFTPLHAAAVLPFTRLPLVPSALVCGAMAPDMPYYVPLRSIWIHYNLTLTHKASGLLLLNPLIALVLLVAFHGLAKRPLLALLPPAIASRVLPAAEGFRPWDVRMLVALPASLVIGAATHVGWDSLCDVLGDSRSVPLGLLSDLVGGIVLLTWLRHRRRTTEPAPLPAGAVLDATPRRLTIALILVTAVVGGAVHVARNLPEVLDGLRERGEMAFSPVADFLVRGLAVATISTLAVSVGVYCLLWQIGRFSGVLPSVGTRPQSPLPTAEPVTSTR